MNSEVSSDAPLVSVSMIAYNHQDFIEQAVNSVLMQQIDFAMELVIGEDNSTDQTRAILKQLQAENPTRIRLLLREQNLGMHQNFRHTLRECRGEFIALLEGDDFWTDENKLQKQVDFLRAHPECAFCHHNIASCRDENCVEREPYFSAPRPEIYDLRELLRGHVHTCSVLLRCKYLPEPFPDWTTQLAMADYPFFVFLAERGSVGYLHQTMAIYRLHAGGVYGLKALVRNSLASIAMFERVDRHLKFGYHNVISERILRFWYDIVTDSAAAGDWQKVRFYGRKCLRFRPLLAHWRLKARVALRLYAAPLWKLMNARRAGK